MLPGSAPAVVNPVTLIQRQIIKPNMLIVFDTSTSMIDAPGEFDYNAMEVGMDCVDGTTNGPAGNAERVRRIGWVEVP